MDTADIDNRFTYHKPDTAKGMLHNEVRVACGELATFINNKLPFECREKSLAITHLEEVMMWANAALARHD